MITPRITALLLAAAALAYPASAVAKDGDVRVNGSCTAGSSSKLKLSQEDGGIEVEFEVDQNRNGVRWNVKMFRNDARFVRTKATTRGPSGSFEVRRVVPGSAGDQIRARAKSPSGEVCTARATFA
jgi:hypothetical protein